MGKKVMAMKKMWRRILLMTAMLVMVFSVYALADATLYSAKTVKYPCAGGWSSQFTLSCQTQLTVNITITGNNQSTYINNGLEFVLENVSTHAKTNLTIPAASRNALNYTLSAIVPAGTYSLGVYSHTSYSFSLRFAIYGTGGIDVPAVVEVMKGTKETFKVTSKDTSGKLIKVKSVSSANKGIATAKADTENNTVTIKGVAIGTTKITVYGSNGSSDVVTVKVTKYIPTPVLNYKTLTMDAGKKIYNAVENATSTVTWSSSNSKVAKVGRKGRITAVGYGKCSIYATTVSNGKTYRLACVVKVNRTLPLFRARLVRYNARRKTLRIRVENLSKVPMTILSRNGSVWDTETDERVGTITLQKGSYVTVGKGKTQKVTFKLKGRKLAKGLELYKLRFFFKQDRRNYYADVFTDVNAGVYCWKRDTSTWNPSYSAS